MKSPDKAKHVDQVKTLELSASDVGNNFQVGHEATAHEFATHPDFAKARADGVLWDLTSLDGLAEPVR